MYIFYNHNIFTHIFERKADQYFWWVVEERKNVCNRKGIRHYDLSSLYFRPLIFGRDS
jgi:hypothetical protein